MSHLPRKTTDSNARAFTLVEMLVATAASVILLAAVMTLFQTLSEAVNDGRRLGVLDAQLCSASQTIYKDLAGVSAARDASGLTVNVSYQNGYFEVQEGPKTDSFDSYPTNNTDNAGGWLPGPCTVRQNSLLGDTDDVILFTTRPVTAEPLTGTLDNSSITSDLAEVAYFCRSNQTTPETYTLYRRIAIVSGVIPMAPFDTNGSMDFRKFGKDDVSRWDAFYNKFDVSVRKNGTQLLLNSLENLTARENRLFHSPTYDNPIKLLPGPATPIRPRPLSGSRIGEDELLSNVLSFDVRVLDPLVKIRQVDGIDLQPGDPGYDPTATLAETGPKFVDLGYPAIIGDHSHFSNRGTAPLQASNYNSDCRIFDTWNTNDPDVPPYAHSLGGIQITLRVYDVSNQSVRQMTISHNF